MTEKEIIQYITDASNAAGHLLDAEPNVFWVGKAPKRPSGYSRRLPFGSQNICLGLRQSATPNVLLNTFIDVTAERIAANCFPIEVAPSGLFIPSIAGPCSAQEWGEDLYRDVQNRLIQSLSFGLSLDIALINHLSAKRYEGAKCEGGLVFDSGQKTNVGALLSMPIEAAAKFMFQTDMLRQIRKLLAGTRDNFLVFCWDTNLREYICKGYCSKAVAAQFEWSVLFTDLLDWKFYHYGHPMFRFLHDDPKVIRDPVAVVLEDLRQTFGPSFPSANARPLLDSGSEQSHGTALIFLDFNDPYTALWIDRLYKNNRAIRLISCKSVSEAVRSLSGMDGALLIDAYTMEVKYFAAIVDGHASVPGDLSRGARHNSIRTFVSDLVSTSPHHTSRVAAVVFSEDGGAVTIKG